MFRRSKQQGMQPPVKSKVLLLVSLSLGLLCLLAVIGYFVLNNAQNTPQEKPKSLAIDFDATSKALASEKQDRNVEEIVEEYGQSFDAAYKEVMQSQPAEWNEDIVTKAHLSLLYADKINSYTQALELYGRISLAKELGVNVDANSAGVTQEVRDDIKRRADAAKVSLKQGGVQ